MDDRERPIEVSAAIRVLRETMGVDMLCVVAFNRDNDDGPTRGQMTTDGITEDNLELQAVDLARLISNLLGAAQTLLEETTRGSYIVIRDESGQEFGPETLGPTH